MNDMSATTQRSIEQNRRRADLERRKTLGAAIRLVREDLGLKEEEMAQQLPTPDENRLHIVRQRMQQYEAGGFLPTLEFFKRFSVFGFSTENELLAKATRIRAERTLIEKALQEARETLNDPDFSVLSAVKRLRYAHGFGYRVMADKTAMSEKEYADKECGNLKCSRPEVSRIGEVFGCKTIPGMIHKSIKTPEEPEIRAAISTLHKAAKQKPGGVTTLLEKAGITNSALYGYENDAPLGVVAIGHCLRMFDCKTTNEMVEKARSILPAQNGHGNDAAAVGGGFQQKYGKASGNGISQTR